MHRAEDDYDVEHTPSAASVATQNAAHRGETGNDHSHCRCSLPPLLSVPPSLKQMNLKADHNPDSKTVQIDEYACNVEQGGNSSAFICLRILVAHFRCKQCPVFSAVEIGQGAG